MVAAPKLILHSPLTLLLYILCCHGKIWVTCTFPGSGETSGFVVWPVDEYEPAVEHPVLYLLTSAVHVLGAPAGGVPIEVPCYQESGDGVNQLLV